MLPTPSLPHLLAAGRERNEQLLASLSWGERLPEPVTERHCCGAGWEWCGSRCSCDAGRPSLAPPSPLLFRMVAVGDGLPEAVGEKET